MCVCVRRIWRMTITRSAFPTPSGKQGFRQRRKWEKILFILDSTKRPRKKKYIYRERERERVVSVGEVYWTRSKTAFLAKSGWGKRCRIRAAKCVISDHNSLLLLGLGEATLSRLSGSSLFRFFSPLDLMLQVLERSSEGLGVLARPQPRIPNGKALDIAFPPSLVEG